MKTFEEIYEEIITADNSELEDLREQQQQERKKGFKIGIIICIIMDILLMRATLKIFTDGGIFIIVLIALGLISNLVVLVVLTTMGANEKTQMKITTKYKRTVIQKLIGNFYENLEYFPQKPMPEYMYKNIEYEYYDEYESEDYFEANINNENSIQMGEVFTQEIKEYENSEGEQETKEITKFHGIFAKVVMQKSIKSELRIFENRYFAHDKEKLELDSSEFEKYFDVKVTNKIIGMQILTADVMEELVKFRANTKMHYDIVIKNNELYIRFHSGNMFEISSSKKGIFDKETIRKYYYMLKFTYDLSSRIIETIKDVNI